MTKASLGVSNLRKAFAANYDSDNGYVDAPIFIDEFYKQLNVVKKLDSIYPMTNLIKRKLSCLTREEILQKLFIF